MSTLLSFPYWAHHFLAFFCKAYEFVQNSVFSHRSACFVIFALGTPFVYVSSKVHEFVQNSLFRRKWARFCNFRIGPTNFSALFSKGHEFVQNSFFSPRSERFVIFALCTPLISDFQQSAWVCTKKRFQLEMTTSFYKTVFLAGYQQVLTFSHWAHHLLAIFSKVHEFVHNSVFSPRSACFVIFTLDTPLFSVSSKVHEFIQKSVFSWRWPRFFPRSESFVIFACGTLRFSHL